MIRNNSDLVKLESRAYSLRAFATICQFLDIRHQNVQAKKEVRILAVLTEPGL